MTQGELIIVPRHDGNEDDNARYTLDEADLWLRARAGVDAWDLDVAAAAESHRAPRFYTAADDGLRSPWDAARIFCNPPWDDIEPWLRLAWAAVAYGDAEVVGMLLPGGRTHRPWWQKWVEPFRDGASPAALPAFIADDYRQHWPLLTTHNPHKRFTWGAPGNVRGVGVPEPNFTTVGIVVRRSRDF